VIYADILISWFLAAVLEIYTQHFTRRLHFTQQIFNFMGVMGLCLVFEVSENRQ
jgi:hypothetical protein